MRYLILAIAALPLAACSANTYNTYQAVPAAPDTQAPAADIAAIDALLDDVYAVISGPAGQPRDFDRMRSLFTSDARLSSITANGISGGTVDDYIARSGPFLVERGFTERQLAGGSRYGAISPMPGRPTKAHSPIPTARQAACAGSIPSSSPASTGPGGCNRFSGRRPAPAAHCRLI